jgi:hypothetical protein
MPSSCGRSIPVLRFVCFACRFGTQTRSLHGEGSPFWEPSVHGLLHGRTCPLDQPCATGDAIGRVCSAYCCNRECKNVTRNNRAVRRCDGATARDRRDVVQPTASGARRKEAAGMEDDACTHRLTRYLRLPHRTRRCHVPRQANSKQAALGTQRGRRQPSNPSSTRTLGSAVVACLSASLCALACACRFTRWFAERASCLFVCLCAGAAHSGAVADSGTQRTDF